MEEVNRFLRSHRVLSVERQFIADGSNSAWCFCVEYLASGQGSAPPQARKAQRVDYKAVLSPAHFAIFARLRSARKELAQQEGIPAFAVCTDEQLAAMAQLDELTAASLQTVPGIGEAKVRKFGEGLIAAFKGTANGEASSQPDAADRGAGEPATGVLESEEGQGGEG